MEQEKKSPAPVPSVDEILAETRARFGGKSYAELIGEPEQDVRKSPAAPAPECSPAAPAPEIPAPAPAPRPESPAPPVKTAAPDAPDAQTPETRPEPAPEDPDPQDAARPEEDPEGNQEPEWDGPVYDIPEGAEEWDERPSRRARRQAKKEEKARARQAKKEEKARRKRERAGGFQAEDDIYYGLQLKNVDEYRRSMDEEPGAPLGGPSPSFAYLFDGTREEEVDEEIAGRFSHTPAKKHAPDAARENVVPFTPRAAQPPAQQAGETVEFRVPDPAAPEDPAARALRDRAARLVDESLRAPRAQAEPPAPQQQWEDISSTSEGAPRQGLESVLHEDTAPPAAQTPPDAEAAGPDLTEAGQEPPAGQEAAPEEPLPEPAQGAEEAFPDEPLPPEEEKKAIRALMDAVPPYRGPSAVHVLEVAGAAAALEHEAKPYAAEGVLPRKDRPAQDPEPHGFQILGEDEEENDPEDEIPEDEGEIDDYRAPEDAPSVQRDLSATNHKLTVRLLATGGMTLLLLFTGLICERGEWLPVVNQYEFDPLAYQIICLCCLLCAMLFSLPTLANGLRGLFRLHANSDSGAAVAAAAVLAQSVALLFQPELVASSQAQQYAALAAGALFLNTAGKCSIARRTAQNFRTLLSPEPKSAVQVLDDHNTALQMAKGCVEGAPVIAYQRRANFFRRFLRYSNQADPSERASQAVAPVGFLLSLLLCAAVLFLTRDAFAALTALAAGACVSAPVYNLLAVNLRVARLCKLARRCGAMLAGYPAVEKYSEVNAVLLDAKDLFPKGTVVLNGIKTFGNEHIDDAILDATALMCAAGGPLSDLFDQIVKSRKDQLPRASQITYEDGRGVSGWVNGRRLLVGNRELLRAHGIEPPSRDYEQKYLLGGRQIAYLASGGELVALFLVSYHSDKRRTLELQRVESHGISLLVATCDPNITPQFLADCFRIDARSVRVLPDRQGSAYRRMVKEPAPTADALFVTKGRATAMLRLLSACVRLRGRVPLAVGLQVAAAALGFALVAFFSCCSGFGQLSTTALFLYELFWSLILFF